MIEKPYREGLSYLYDRMYEISKNLHPQSNLYALPEYRALQKSMSFPNITLENAKKLLEEEKEWQKPENMNKYPGFKWF